jgi:hypothetical protein
VTTVIDELVVELGLDPKKFTQGQQAAIAAFKRTQDEATLRAKAIEAAGQRAAQFFTRLRNEALGFFALLVGGHEIKEFVVSMTTANAATNRLGRSIGVSAVEIATWGNAARLVGGSAEAMAGSFRGFSDEMQELQATGESSLIPTLYAIGRAGGRLIDVNRPLHSIFLDLADDLSVISRRDPAQAHWLGRRLGLDESMINLLVRGRAATRAVLDEVAALNPKTREQLDNAEALATAWQRASVAAEGLGESLLNSLTPGMTGTLRELTEYLSLIRRGVESGKGLGASYLDALKKSFGLGTESPALQTGGAGLRVKPGSGEISLGALALASQLQSKIPELREFTAFDDAYHGSRGAHGAGRGLDFTIADQSKYAEIADRVRALLGPGARVIDEKNHPSSRATGPHIHVELSDEEMARRVGSVGGRPGAGVTNRSSSVSKEVHIGTLNVNAPQATDATSIAREIYGALDDVAYVANADFGAA